MIMSMHIQDWQYTFSKLQTSHYFNGENAVSFWLAESWMKYLEFGVYMLTTFNSISAIIQFLSAMKTDWNNISVCIHQQCQWSF
jgi:hypothetical protein